MASADTSLLGAFRRHVDDMRGLIHCQICLNPFYEPFTLACGHTYCYSCLSSWTNSPHNGGGAKGCPDCRNQITTEPSPNYTLRELVHMFLNRVELLPEGETVQEHQKARDEEARALAEDRNGAGLFKGLFQRRRPESLFRRIVGLPRVIHDAEDGVTRCPRCTWELEDGECNQCGWAESDLYSDSESDGSIHRGHELAGYISDEDDRDISPIDEFGGPVDIPILPAGSRPAVPAGPRFQPRPLSEDESDVQGHRGQSPRYFSLDEEDSEMDDFIDDDDLPDEVENDAESVRTVSTTTLIHQLMHSTDNGSLSDDSEDEGPLLRRRLNHTIVNEPDVQINIVEDSDSENETNTQATQYDTDTNTNASEPQTVYDESAEESDDSVREIPPPVPVAHSRQRRVVESEDEDEENLADRTSEESDDTAIRAPQSAAARRQRLSARRASNVRQASHESRSPQPRQSSAGNWARRGPGVFRGRGNTLPRRAEPYTSSTRVY